MSSEVYFAQRRATQGGGLLEKLEQLCDAAGFGTLLCQGPVAVCLSFGEPGNTTFVRPQFAERIVRKLRQYGAQPFLADTLAPGSARRANAVAHLGAAAAHGYTQLSGDTPIVVADGLFGRDEVCLDPEADGQGPVRIASAIAQAEGVLGLCHVTGQAGTGFAGALHNLGYGASSLAGKAAILSGGGVTVPVGASEPLRGRSSAEVQERLVEALHALSASKPGRIGYVNLLVDLTPHDDNQGWSDAAVVPDIGLLASRDPVAIDQASVDLVNQTAGISSTRLADPNGRDKFRDLFPGVDWEVQLRHAERLGLGRRDYELMII